MFVFFFNDTATTEIYTLSLHDALPISEVGVTSETSSRGNSTPSSSGPRARRVAASSQSPRRGARDRKSTRLNSSHANISYAVFCLKKKKKQTKSKTHDYVHSTSVKPRA